MDILTIIIWIIIVYILWTLISTISSLQKEVKEMKEKCIKSVYKNKKDVLEENNTKDPIKILKDTYDTFKQYIM